MLLDNGITGSPRNSQDAKHGGSQALSSRAGNIQGAATHGNRGPERAAQYVRMSTEHQQYSTENQSDEIRRYAEQRGIEIVRTYSDAGKSGLRIQGRKGLQQLLFDIQSGAADFETVIVYDISRWGRFQDADESAYYEYICKRAGISVSIALNSLRTTAALFLQS